MPVYRTVNLTSVPLYGDGVSTVATVDLHAYLEALEDSTQHVAAGSPPSVYPVVPLIVLHFTSTNISSIAVQEQSLVITYTSAFSGIDLTDILVGY